MAVVPERLLHCVTNLNFTRLVKYVFKSKANRRFVDFCLVKCTLPSTGSFRHVSIFEIGTPTLDVGFDPLGLDKSQSDLMNIREAEVNHARLAMFAAAGRPVPGMLDKKIASGVSAFGTNPVLDNTDPSH